MRKKSSVYTVIKSGEEVCLPLSWKQYEFTEEFSNMEEGVQTLVLQGNGRHSMVVARPRKN